MTAGMHKLAVVVILGGAGVARADGDKFPASDGTVKVTLGQPSVAAGVDGKAIETVVKRIQPKLLACYRHEHDRDPDAGGYAKLVFTIGSDGKVSAAKVTGVEGDLATCSGAVVKAMVFTKPKGGKPVDVTYPILYDNGYAVGFASLTGVGDSSGGFDDPNIYGGLVGEQGDSGGGGGGTGWGTIGTGTSGSGGGYGVGGGRGGLRGRPSPVPTISIGQPNVQGDLDKAIVRRYIKRNLQKLTYCYEKVLLHKKGIRGTVQTQFTIKADGKVKGAVASGVDKEVSTCVADVISAIEFPKPKTPDDVLVNYPFTYRPADEPTPATK